LNQTIVFKAYDGKNYNAAPPFTGTSAQADFRTDIVPYISEVITRLNSAYPIMPSAFNRSALGWYPVRDGETIQIRGFNFNGTSTGVQDEYGTALGSITVGTGGAQTHISATVGGSIKSGALTVKVNGIESVNNKDQNAAPGNYNREPNNLNNNILTNDRNIYVWNTGQFLTTQTANAVPVAANNLTSPFMRMDSQGNTYVSAGGGTMSMVVYKNTLLQNILEQCYNKYHNTTVSYDSSGNFYAAGTNTDRITNETTGATSFAFFNRAQGNRWLGSGANYNDGTNKRRLELSYNGATGVYNINRVQIPRLAVTGNTTSAKVHMSYYDGNNPAHPVKFRYGVVTGPDAMTGGFAANLDDNNPGSAAGAVVVANDSTAHKGGLYTAVGALSTGRAVIAWYDAVAQALVFSYSNSTTNPGGDNTAVWQDNARVVDDDFAGWHVDLTVDGANNVHLAYYTSGNGGLRYAYLKYNGGSTVFDSAQVATVDTYLSAGYRLMINTRAEIRAPGTVYVPYISYYHASFPLTRNSIRVAWRNDWTTPDTPPNGTVNDQFTGAWEAMTIPTDNIPAEDFVCNGVPSTGTVSLGPGGAANLTNRILLAYSTNQYYERAYLKK
jgi:hypothetical protein